MSFASSTNSLRLPSCLIAFAASTMVAASAPAQDSSAAARIVDAINNGITDPELLVQIMTEAGKARRPDGLRFRRENHAVNTGAVANRSDEFKQSFTTIVQSPGTRLMRLHFSPATSLGEKSYIQLISHEDGGNQKFTSSSLANWEYWSAIFNGSSVELQLHIAPGETASLTIDQIAVDDFGAGGPAAPGGGIASLCGADNRVASNDSRVGRLSGINCGNGGGCGGCTGWLVSNGAVLTAGHCVDDPGDFIGDLIEFNVPMSDANGSPNAADPDDQYPIGTFYAMFQSNGVGEDWAVLSVGPNSDTGLNPHIAQGFFHMSSLVPSGGSTIRVTGFGVDNTPAGPGGAGSPCCDADNDDVCEFNCNSSAYTQQTATGPLDELAGTTLEYEVDTTPANSGSPVIRDGNGFAIGIHTAGGCEFAIPDDNQGTWFGYGPLNTALNQAIENATFVDAQPVSSIQIGNVLNPARTVIFGGAVVANGGTMFVVAGNYTAAAGNVGTLGTGNKAFTITTPVGGVVIGQ